MARQLRRKTNSDQNSRFCTKKWLSYARNSCQNKFVARDELPAVPAASESTVARVQTSAVDDRQRISAF